jgi:hypothetical protein
VAASVEQWKRLLLDLTKRNRALNFRPARVSTVAIVDERPAELFRQLVVRERAMRFKAAPEAADAADGATTGRGGARGGGTRARRRRARRDDPAPAALEFAPYDPADLAARHTDEWLQTALAPDALDRALRRLDEQGRLAVEEQGVHTLFLALGMLHYAEGPAPEPVLRAPLVLVPVELVRRSARPATSCAPPATTRSSTRRWPSTCAASSASRSPSCPTPTRSATTTTCSSSSRRRRPRSARGRGGPSRPTPSSRCSASRSS